jgi:hypothetical protein
MGTTPDLTTAASPTAAGRPKRRPVAKTVSRTARGATLEKPEKVANQL